MKNQILFIVILLSLWLLMFVFLLKITLVVEEVLGASIPTSVIVENTNLKTTVLPNECNTCLLSAKNDKQGKIWCYNKYCK
jgi:hypothetical protein